jgi:hypothetical protein
MKRPAGRRAANQFDRPHLNDALAVQRVKAGRLGVEDYLTHGLFEHGAYLRVPKLRPGGRQRFGAEFTSVYPSGSVRVAARATLPRRHTVGDVPCRSL